jgi:hypothetical protein
MKTITLSVEDALYDHLMALIDLLPTEKIHIQQESMYESKQDLSVEDVGDYVLKKNAELYKRLS